MRVNISGHHVEITAALRDYVEEKIKRLERHSDRLDKIHVILRVEKERQKAEATIHVYRSDIFADAEAESMYAAIDGLMDKLDRQIKKHKAKLQGRPRTAHKNRESE